MPLFSASLINFYSDCIIVYDLLTVGLPEVYLPAKNRFAYFYYFWFFDKYLFCQNFFVHFEF